MAYSIPFYPRWATSSFGATAGRPNAHRGQDVAPGGLAFPSWVNGVVVVSSWHSALGNRVVVRNNDDGYFIGVSHLITRDVTVGTVVKIGTRLGIIGNTGSASRGRHAHVTVSRTSKLPELGPVIDPVAYARNAGSSSAGGGGTMYIFSKDSQTKLQEYMFRLGLYTGPIDGDLGKQSWIAIQKWLAAIGLYTGNIDGVPGSMTYTALQVVGSRASRDAYTGPKDGDYGPNSESGLNSWLSENLAPKLPTGIDWAAWQTLLQAHGYTGPIDGAPGEFTFTALQTFLKAKFGYTGSIDGVPGDMTWAAFGLAVAAGYPKPPVIVPPVDNAPVEPPVVVAPPAVPVTPEGYDFGIDVGTSQKDLDFVAFKNAGGTFAIVKAGGSNASDSPYLAPNYIAGTGQLGKARTAGLLVGHYWMNGNRNGLTPVTSAEYFAKHVAIQEGDLLALDIEAIDGVPAYTPAEALEFIETFQLVYPGAKFLIYLNRGLMRGADWTAVVEAGHSLWLATLDGTIAPELTAWASASIVQYAIQPVPGSGAVPVDCNIGVANLSDLGYVPESEPTPEPVPAAALAAFLVELAALVAKYTETK